MLYLYIFHGLHFAFGYNAGLAFLFPVLALQDSVLLSFWCKRDTHVLLVLVYDERYGDASLLPYGDGADALCLRVRR